MPSPTTAPQASENTAAIRASGNPRPGFWATGWGYSAWFAGVSGMVTDDPSYTYTRRPFHSHPSSAPSSSARPVRRAVSEKNASGSRLRAWQYAPVRAEHGLLPPRDAVGDQAGDGGPAGVVGAEHLAEEHPQGDQRGEDPVQPPADGGQRLGEDVLGEDVGERQVAVLEELAAQEGGLVAERPRVRMPHPSDLRAGDDGLPTPIFTGEAPPGLYPVHLAACGDRCAIRPTRRGQFVSWRCALPVTSPEVVEPVRAASRSGEAPRVGLEPTTHNRLVRYPTTGRITGSMPGQHRRVRPTGSDRVTDRYRASDG